MNTIYTVPTLPIRDKDRDKLINFKKKDQRLSLVSLVLCAYSIGATIFIIFLIAVSITNISAQGQPIIRFIRNQSKFAQDKDSQYGWSKSPNLRPRPSLEERCQNGWRYFNLTRFCYYLRNFTHSNPNYSETFTFWGAEGECRKMNAHLASVHSRIERNFMNDLILTDFSSLLGIQVEEKSLCRFPHYVWVGSYQKNGTKTWTDGTPDNFSLDDEPKDHYVAMCYDVFDKRNGKYTTYDLPMIGDSGQPLELARYMCKKASRGAS